MEIDKNDPNNWYRATPSARIVSHRAGTKTWDSEISALIRAWLINNKYVTGGFQMAVTNKTKLKAKLKWQEVETAVHSKKCYGDINDIMMGDCAICEELDNQCHLCPFNDNVCGTLISLVRKYVKLEMYQLASVYVRKILLLIKGL